MRCINSTGVCLVSLMLMLMLPWMMGSCTFTIGNDCIWGDCKDDTGLSSATDPGCTSTDCCTQGTSPCCYKEGEPLPSGYDLTGVGERGSYACECNPVQIPYYIGTQSFQVTNSVGDSYVQTITGSVPSETEIEDALRDAESMWLNTRPSTWASSAGIDLSIAIVRSNTATEHTLADIVTALENPDGTQQVFMYEGASIASTGAPFITICHEVVTSSCIHHECDTVIFTEDSTGGNISLTVENSPIPGYLSLSFIFLHEMGHTFGLDDNPSFSTSVMNGVVSRSEIASVGYGLQTPSDDDMNALAYIYGH